MAPPDSPAPLAVNPTDRFLAEDWEPVYLEAHRNGTLSNKVDRALDELADCRACPRDCGVDRISGDEGVCGIGRYALVSSAFPHLGEEECLRGWRGSGTIFFASCNLRCVFCQNWDISQRSLGKASSGAELAAVMLELQAAGCHNINFVTPEHVAPQVVEAIGMAVPQGLHLPIVYNTSAYDALTSLQLLDGLIDIYMPDFKFWEPETARRLARTADYPDRARQAIAEMHRQVGPLLMGTDGLARRGVLVRHLVMPGLLAESAAIFSWLADELSPDTYVNVMAQYRPDYRVGESEEYADINRRTTPEDISGAYEAARRAGLWRFDRRA